VESRALLVRGGFRWVRALILSLLAAACSAQMNLPTVSDDPVERFVRSEAAKIIAVSEDEARESEYRIFLSEFPRKDVLGMSVGDRRIYIRYELAKLASTRFSYLWLLRTKSPTKLLGTPNTAVSHLSIRAPWRAGFRAPTSVFPGRCDFAITRRTRSWRRIQKAWSIGASSVGIAASGCGFCKTLKGKIMPVMCFIRPTGACSKRRVFVRTSTTRRDICVARMNQSRRDE